jgi:hypothetical protein
VTREYLLGKDLIASTTHGWCHEVTPIITQTSGQPVLIRTAVYLRVAQDSMIACAQKIGQTGGFPRQPIVLKTRCRANAMMAEMAEKVQKDVEEGSKQD